MKKYNLVAIIFCFVLLVNATIACVWFTSVANENGPTPSVTNFEEPTATPEIPSEPTADSTLTVEEGVNLGSSQEYNTFTESKYYITGVITEIYNSTHGNMKITDKTGKILTIYGTWNADGTTRYDKLNVKPVAGDTVTIYGVVGQYNGVPQLKNGWIVAHTPATPEETTSEPTTEPVTDPTGSNPVDPDQPEPHEHSYKAVVTPATCETAGYTTYTCSCSHSYTKDGEAALGHVDTNFDHNCDRNCGKTDMGTHADSNEDTDHVCDYGCGAVLEDCVDADKDHACDNGCDKTFGTCEDADTDHACDYGCSKYFGEHEDTDKDHACDYGCKETIGTCEDADKDHACDYGCDKVFGDCVDADKDHACDYGCDKVFGTHADSNEDDDHVCDYGCGAVLEDCVDADKDHACDNGCDKVFGTCEDADKDHDCDYGCDKVFGTCVDADKDHACDYGCNKVFGTCADADKDHACDYGCDKYFGEHEDTDKDHACDYGCKETIGTCVDADKDHDCDYGCDKVFGTCEDADKDHACDYGCDKYFGEHKDNDKDHACDYGCNVTIGTCEDADKDHNCDYGCDKVFGTHADSNEDTDHVCDYGCGAVLEDCVDADKDHACDNGCDKIFGTCEDADKDHDCDYGCDKVFGDCVDADKDHDCDYGCDKVFGNCVDADRDHACDYGCDKYFGEHKDNDKDHACDYGCNVTIGTCEDADKDHACDYGCSKYFGAHADSAEDDDHVCDYGCGETIEDCFGGTATCTARAKCIVCGEEYGSILGHIDENTDHKCDRNCGENNMGTHADSAEDDDHLCDYGCGVVLEDCYGGTATCTAKAVCTVCGKEYGSLLEHVDANFDHKCDRNCGKTDMGTHADSEIDNDHLCDYGCKETIEECSGGIATCQTQATCEICGKKYGELGNHSMSTNWTSKDDKHFHECTIDGCDYTEDEANCFGGTATCTEAAECAECGTPYGDPKGHTYTQKIETAEYLKEEGENCQEHHTYYFACEDCDASSKGGSNTFFSGSATGDHVISDAWTTKDEQHFHKCTVDGCDYVQDTANCSGGEATCTEAAECSACGQKYGTALGHDYTETEDNIVKYAATTCQEFTTYWYDCSHCGNSAKDDPNATDKWYTTNETGSHAMSNTWTTKNEQHFHKCTVDGCDHTEDKADCFGGTATCTEAAKCSACGTSYGDPTGHTYSKKLETAEYLKEEGANCQEHHTYYFACEDCGASSKGGTNTFFSGSATGDHVISDAWTTENKQHFHECTVDGCDHTEDKADCSGGTATCTEAAKCSACGKEYAPALGHDYTNTEDNTVRFAATTCQELTTYWYDCSRCGNSAKDDVNATDRWYESAETGNHIMSDAWTTEDGQHFHKCTVSGCDHTSTPENCFGGEATCTEGAKCSACGKEYAPALGHDYTNTETNTIRTTATYCKEFNTYWYDCSRCGGSAKDDANATDKWYTSAEAGNHIMSVTWTTENGQHFHKCTVAGCDHTSTPENCSGGEATCTAAAQCSTCGKEYGPAPSHTAGAAATCTAPQTCTVCHVELSPALDHTWNAATCLAPQTCSVCGATQGESGEHDIDNAGVCGTCGQNFMRTITFLDGSTEVADPVSGIVGEKIPTLPTPKKSNYNFAGWYTDEACTNAFNETTFSTTLTLYAKWVSNTNEQIKILSYYANSSNGTISNQHIPQVIERANKPDIICVQNAGSNWKSFVPSEYTASLQNSSAPLVNDGNSDGCNVIFYKTDMFTAINGSDGRVSIGNGTNHYATYIILQHNNGSRVAVINAWFDNNNTANTAENETARNAQLQGLVAQINAIWSNSGYGLMPMIITSNFGDLTEPNDDSHIYQGLTENHPFADAATVAKSPSGSADKGADVFVSYHMQSAVESYEVLGIQNGKYPILVKVALPNCSHILVKTEATDATCTAGNKEYYTCSLCAKVFADVYGAIETTVEDCKIPALGHSYDAAVIIPPTCEEDGYILHTCSVCGDTYYSIPLATGHAWTNACDTKCNNGCGTTREAIHNYEWVIDTPPTSTTQGIKHEECTICHNKRNENTPAVNCTHELAKTEATAATCTAAGNKEYYTCSICNNVYSDAEGTLETNLENCVINALGHTWVAATCTTPKTCSVCDATQGEPIGHQIDSAGICSACGESLVKTITFLDGSTNVAAPVSGIVGEEFTLPSPTKKNYTFAGWYLDSDGTVAFEETTFRENLTLYAKWTSNTGDQVSIFSYYGGNSGWTADTGPTKTAIKDASYPSILCLRQMGAAWRTLTITNYTASTKNNTSENNTTKNILIYYKTSEFEEKYSVVTDYYSCIVLQCKNGNKALFAVVNFLFSSEADKTKVWEGINSVWNSYGLIPMIVTGSFGGATTTQSIAYTSLTENDLFVDASKTAQSFSGTNADDGDYIFASHHVQSAVKSYSVLTKNDGTLYNGRHPIIVEVVFPKVACAHKLAKTAAVDATCTTAGNKEYYTCSTCSKVYADAKCTIETTAAACNVPALGHTAGIPATCTTAQTCTVCHIELAAARGHDIIIDEAVAATCTTTGLTQGQHCTRCNAQTVEQQVIAALGHEAGPDATCTTAQTCIRCDHVFQAALGHDIVVDKAIDATCETGGLTQGYHCSRCDDATLEQQVTDALGHKAGAAATCTTPQICTRCDHVLQSALGHNIVIDEAVAATCTTTGLTEGSHCTRCDDVTVEQQVIKALGHNIVIDEAVAATCTTTGLIQGSHCSRCDGATVEQQVIDALGHNIVIDEAVAATCTTTGLTEGSHCTRCDDETVEQEITEALGHNIVIDEAVAATCTTTGLTEGSHCTRCNGATVEQQVTKALGHNYIWVVDLQPTFETEGVMHKECTVCHSTRNENTPVDKLACSHELAKTEAVEATCTTAGNREYYTCSLCEKVYSNAEGTLETTKEDCKIDALGHQAGASATCTTAQTCIRCDHVFQAALGHNELGTVAHVDATCTKNGVTGGTYCDRCNEGKAAAEEIIEKYGHNADGIVAHVDETCTENGIVGGTYCNRCNRGKEAAEKLIPASGHTAGTAATCTTAQICKVCSAEITEALGHNYNRTITHVEPTCTEDGVTGGYYCSRCDDGKAEAVVVLEKLGHNAEGFVKPVEPTCTEPGVVGGTYCKRCNEGKAAAETILIKLGHNTDGFVKHVEPTCTEPGTTGGIYCNRCDKGKAAAEAPIPASGHNDFGNVDHVNATCTENGIIGGKFCTVCKHNKAEAEAVIPAKGHTPTEAATCTTAQICTVCYEQLAAPLGHTWTNATCTAPQTCSVCHATQGEPIDHQLSSAGVCSICKQIFMRTVNFLSGNINTGNQIAEPVSGLVGETISFPVPQMSNYKLNGWYLDSACTKPFNETTFGENLTLYAKWVANTTEQTTVLSYYGNNSGWTNDDGYGKLAIKDAGYPDVISFHKMGVGWMTLTITDYTASSKNKDTQKFITYYKTDKFTEIDSAYTGDYSYIILQRKDETKFAVVNVLFESGTEEEKLAKLQEGLNNIWSKNGLMPTIIAGAFGSATTTDSVVYKWLTETSQFVDTSKDANSITGVSNTDPGHYVFASYHMQSSVDSYKVLTERNGKDPVLVGVALPKACALIKKEATAATCSTMGNKEYYYCATCGKIYLDAMGTREVTAADCMIPALDHDWTDATCTSPKTCSTCGVTEGVARDHVWTNACDITCNNDCGTTRVVEHDYEWVIDTPPTVTTEGIKHEECTVCHVKRSEYTPVDKLACAHALVKTAATAATCTTTGNKEYYTCSICKKVYFDAAGILETTVEGCKIAVLDHTWTNATCTSPKTCSVCTTTEGEALGHSWKEATCNSPKTCSVCNATQGEPVAHDINDASICNICGGYFLRKINFKGGKLSSGTYAYDNTQIAASVYGLVGEKFSYPEITLQLKGYNFAGWCTDYACTKSYTGTTFSEDMTLYAKWVSNADRIVTVMSFNVKTGGSLSKSGVVTGTIRDANPDVFGVQEADVLWMTSLRSEFKNDYTIVGESSGSGETCAVFYRTSMFTCLESGTKWLSNTPDKESAYSYTEGGTTYTENYKRVMTYVVLQRKDNGAKFLYVNTHLDNNGSNSHEVAEKIREGEVHNMMKIINGITSRRGNIPVIVNGDFNVVPFTRLAYNAMTGTYGYLDSSRIAKEGGPSTTFTESSDENSGIILDYIFVSPNLKGYVETYYVCPAKRDGKWVSDHNAIVAKIAIP